MSGHAGPKLMYRNILSLSRSHQITLASFIDSNEQNMASILEDSGIEVHTVNSVSYTHLTLPTICSV